MIEFGGSSPQPTESRTLVSRVRGAWHQFWFEETDGLRLGMVRIGFAAVSLCFWMGMLPGLRFYYTNDGDFPIVFARNWGSEWFGRLFMPDLLGGELATTVLAVLFGVALLALLVGWRTRPAAVATLLLTYWFHHRNPTFLTAGDAVLRLTSLYVAAAFVAVAPIDRALSLDRVTALRRREAQGDSIGPSVIPVWPLRMIQIQLALIYVVSGFWKLVDPAWRNGTALWIALDSPLFSRFGPPPLAPQGLFAVATLVVALWEFLFPLLIWWNRTRCPALAMGVALHSSILVFMNIGVFPLAMLALYPALLLPEECKVLIGRWPSGRGWKMTRSRLKVENPELSRSTCHLSFRLPASSHRDELRASIIGRGR